MFIFSIRYHTYQRNKDVTKSPCKTKTFNQIISYITVKTLIFQKVFTNLGLPLDTCRKVFTDRYDPKMDFSMVTLVSDRRGLKRMGFYSVKRDRKTEPTMCKSLNPPWTNPHLLEKSTRADTGSCGSTFEKEDYDRRLRLKLLKSRRGKRRGDLSKKTKKKKEDKEERNRENLESNLQSLLERLSGY